MEKKEPKVSSLTVILLITVTLVAVSCVFLSLIYPDFITQLSGGAYTPGYAIYDAIYVVLTVAADAVYLLGGAVIGFGALLVTIRFIQTKIKNPLQPSLSTRYLSGYLTLSLNFFIGAEILRTVAIRTYDEIILLMLILASRVIFSLILYLDRRLHGTAETE